MSDDRPSVGRLHGAKPTARKGRERAQRAGRFWPWSEGEVRLAALILSPEWLGTAAREHGDAVLGMPAALREAAKTLFSLRESAAARAARAGEEPALVRHELRGGLRVLGAGARWQAVEPLGAAPFREIALAAWGDRPEPISDLRWIMLPALRTGFSERAAARCQILATLAVIEALGKCLADAGGALNRAVLDRRVWARRSPEVVIYHEIAPDDVRPIVFDPTKGSVRAALAKGVLRAREVAAHPLDPVGRWIVARWLRAGFLASPGGATVSAVGALWKSGIDDPHGTGIDQPHGALLPGQGVPINVAVGAIDTPTWRIPVRITFDHRALDASAARYLHPRLHDLVPAIMGKMLCSEASSSGDRAELA